MKYEAIKSLMDIDKAKAATLNDGSLVIGCHLCGLPLHIPKQDWNGDINSINITHIPNSIRCPCGAHFHIVNSEITQ